MKKAPWKKNYKHSVNDSNNVEEKEIQPQEAPNLIDNIIKNAGESDKKKPSSPTNDGASNILNCPDDAHEKVSDIIGQDERFEVRLSEGEGLSYRDSNSQADQTEQKHCKIAVVKLDRRSW